MRKAVYIFFTIVIVLVIGTYLFLQQETFGAKPSGKRLELIKKSKNYRDGKFQNSSPTPTLTEGYSYTSVFYNFFFKSSKNQSPKDSIPSVKTDLKALPPQANVLIWFGHSSYLMQVEGKTFLVDPVLSGYASPIKMMNKAFIGTTKYQVEDLPAIDYLLISHDHYDHLDFETIKKLQPKVGQVICPLGVGAHFEKWGYPAAHIIEKDWGDAIDLANQIRIYLTPARHFSGRGLSANNTLWTSYVLETPLRKIFIGGDSGYDKHFAAIGEKFGSFDLAILENGQYNEAWSYIHTLPEEFFKVAKDLKAKRVLPVHAGKFNLGGHAWDEPYKKLAVYNTNHLPLVTPIIGEIVDLDNDKQVFSNWWEAIAAHKEAN
ncbi:MBL fold metallo-hydrolase [Pedobacter sp.]|uniref:MBL fold metallo-hydrolase n=1 Tax=Pedobacter sp. TaxID=1411316 RepID=UPI003D7F2CC1